MTSAKQIAANRRNGRKSRGPRAAADKSRTRFNALRHGLAAVTRRNRLLAPVIERIAKAICADDQNPLLFEQALTIAENEIVLIRVRAERVAAIERGHNVAPGAIELRDEAAAMRLAMPDVERLARYERRAWSRQKRAIRDFMEIKADQQAANARLAVLLRRQCSFEPERCSSALIFFIPFAANN